MIMQYGQAAHRPSSQESKEKASSLWRAHYGPLITKHTGNDELSFVQWASQVEEGEWYYFEATDTGHQRLDIPNLLSIFAADHVNTDDGTWVDNAADVDLASKKLQLWVSDKGLAEAKTLDELLVRSSAILWDLMMAEQAAWTAQNEVTDKPECIRDDALVGSDGELLSRWVLRNRVVLATSSSRHH